MREIDGDLLDPANGFRAIGHGVNLHGVMGAGVALGIARKYPEILDPYRANCATGRLRLGGCWPFSVEDGPRIYNLASQDAPGANADIEALWSSVSLALVDCWRHGIEELALPEIGCGIGGLEWDSEKLDGRRLRYVRDVLEALDDQSPVSITIVHFVPTIG